MMLNENTIKSFWNLTPEQENRMMQNTREYLIREKSIKKEKITIARNMIKKDMKPDIIEDITGLSQEEIKKLIAQK